MREGVAVGEKREEKREGKKKKTCLLSNTCNRIRSHMQRAACKQVSGQHAVPHPPSVSFCTRHNSTAAPCTASRCTR